MWRACVTLLTCTALASGLVPGSCGAGFAGRSRLLPHRVTTSPRLVALEPIDERERLRAENERLRMRVQDLESTLERTEGLCEVLDDGGGWASGVPTRAAWLLGLLVCQSFSSFILADHESLLQSHPTIIYFMTMLVGAGGNAGNQAAVRIIRGLATGEVSPGSPGTTRIVTEEFARAFALGAILVAAGFVRVVAFHGSLVDAAAISASLFLIVVIAVCLGTLLPLLLSSLRVDAAHASTTIQVLMDVLGVLITCTVAPLVFDAMIPMLGL